MILHTQFCHDWMIKIITKKQTVIFPKETENQPSLNIFSTEIKSKLISDSYTYLRVRFSTNGSFKENKVILQEKTRRSIFGTCRSLNFLKFPVGVINFFKSSSNSYVWLWGLEHLRQQLVVEWCNWKTLIHIFL